MNLLWLVPSVVGGSEEYALGLLDALTRETGLDHSRVTVFVNRRTAKAHLALAESWHLRIAPVEGASKPARVVAESTWLAREARRERLGLVHHLGGVVPWIRSTPVVLTIHDLQPLVLPENFGRVKRAYLRAALPMSVRAASRIVTLTDAAARDVVDVLGVDPERVEVIHPGFTIGSAPADAEELRRVRSRYGLGDRPVFVYPVITYPHKNHRVLLEGFAELARERPEPLLVLPGGEGAAELEVRQHIERLGLAQRVRRVGRVPREDVDALLCTATALTFPSRFEGFGLPVLEAMGHGCPVVVAAATALPEVVGDAGLLVSPDEPDEWRAAMNHLLDDPEERQRLSAAGRARAASFSWSEAARRTVELWAREVRW